MTILPAEHNKERPFLKIVEREKIDLLNRLLRRRYWNIFFGTSYEGRESKDRAEAMNDVTKPILMDANDLKQFASEIRRLLKTKPIGESEPMPESIRDMKDNRKKLVAYYDHIVETQPPDETKLSLTFRENKPQFKSQMRFMKKGISLSEDRLEGKVEFSAGFNINYSVIKYTQEEDQYLYEDGGRHRMHVQYYSPRELQKFADDLDAETQLD